MQTWFLILAPYYAGMGPSIKGRKTNLTLREGEIQSPVVPKRESGMGRDPVGTGREVEVEVTMVMAGFLWQEKQINTIPCRLINVAILAAGLVICKWRGGQRTGQCAGSISNFFF